jgi:hypothetical protein
MAMESSIFSVFWLVMLCVIRRELDVSEEHIVSIFRVEE